MSEETKKALEQLKAKENEDKASTQKTIDDMKAKRSAFIETYNKAINDIARPEFKKLLQSFHDLGFGANWISDKEITDTFPKMMPAGYTPIGIGAKVNNRNFLIVVYCNPDKQKFHLITQFQKVGGGEAELSLEEFTAEEIDKLVSSALKDGLK